jgi:hypothetical protein
LETNLKKMKTPIRFSALPLGALSLCILGLTANAQAQNYNVIGQSQRDGRWSSRLLGFSGSYTIGSDGCVVTSASMIYTSWGLNYNPASTNDMLKARNAFSGALVKWAFMPGYCGVLDYSNRPADINVMRSYLNNGYRLMAETRMGSAHQYTHYIVVNGVTANGDLMVVDPWFGDRVLFSQRFGSPSRWVYSVRLFR